MKRDCELRCGEASPPPKRLASSMVSLNVGGKHFDTTQETLRKAACFQLYLTGSIFTKQVPSFVLHPLLPILPADVFPGPIKQSLGVMEHAVDQAGRLFVDRDPDMFRCLLQFMRASTGPPQNYLKTNKETLLEECRFLAWTI